MKYLYLLGASLLAATPAWAQDAEEEDRKGSEIVIAEPLRDDFVTLVVTGRKEYVGATNRAASVISSDELDRIQGPDLSRTLERLPGVLLARSGGLGSQTSLFVRGASSEQLMVLIDGVPVEDVASPSGGFDLGTLSAGGIGKVELLRGPNSLIWGSDGLGGVMVITSLENAGQRASVEYGANNSFDAQGGLTIGDQSTGLSVNAGYSSSDGISAFAGGTEKDPFRQWRVSAQGRAAIADELSLSASGRYVDSKIDFDGFPPPTYSFADTPEYQFTRQGSGRLGIEWFRSSRAHVSASLSYAETRRAYYDPTYGPASNFDTMGGTWRADLRGHMALDSAADWTLDFGGDSNWSDFSTTFDPRRTARVSGGYLVLNRSIGEANFSGGVRYDNHDRYGGKWTFGADLGLNLGDEWRLRASWGQGFKAPSLSQLYGYGGNSALKPETSNGFELGIAKNNRNSGLFYALTLFRRDSTNLIDYVSPTGYFNIGKTRAQGIELEGGWMPADGLRLSASYTYLEADNRVTGKRLARRPRHSASASLDWTTPLGGLELGADLRVVGDRFDDAGNFVPMNGYGLVTLRASVPIGEKFTLYARVENVTDEQYQTVSGYGTYGRSAYAGVRLKW